MIYLRVLVIHLRRHLPSAVGFTWKLQPSTRAYISTDVFFWRWWARPDIIRYNIFSSLNWHGIDRQTQRILNISLRYGIRLLGTACDAINFLLLPKSNSGFKNIQTGLTKSQTTKSVSWKLTIFSGTDFPYHAISAMEDYLAVSLM